MLTSHAHTESSLRILAEIEETHSQILSPGALAFLTELVHRFSPRVERILSDRTQRHARFDGGELPDFLEETRSVREGDWVVGSLPHDLLDRRVEITGPVERKMIINALNSGANVFMADFEDSNAPTWKNILDGQVNLRDAIDGTIEYIHPKNGKVYTLGDHPATLMVRPRGWHLREAHVEVDGETIPAALFDFGLYFFHNAKNLCDRGTGPYFYLPKLEGHLEARLWNDIFVWSQETLGLPRGTTKATVLIETLPAAFEMDEILFELQEHSAGLNCGRWDYIFSFLKTFRARREFILPDRGRITMSAPFMRAYTQLLIRTCHRREVHAIGGMAAQIPIKGDEDANTLALEKVREDKRREVNDGHDGTWVAHPALVPLAKEIFDNTMETPHQIHRKRTDVQVHASDLLALPEDQTRTWEALRHNIRVGIQYLEAWLNGSGCVPLYHLMEDAATAEICRAQVWQWLHHSVELDDGQTLTLERFEAALNEEVASLRVEMEPTQPNGDRLQEAADLFFELSTAQQCADFLTLSAYEKLIA